MTAAAYDPVATLDAAVATIAETTAYLQRLLDATAAAVHDLRPSPVADPVEWDLATMDAADRLVVGSSNVGHIAAVIAARLARVQCLVTEAAPPSLELEPIPAAAPAELKDREMQ